MSEHDEMPEVLVFLPETLVSDDLVPENGTPVFIDDTCDDLLKISNKFSTVFILPDGTKLKKTQKPKSTSKKDVSKKNGAKTCVGQIWKCD